MMEVAEALKETEGNLAGSSKSRRQARLFSRISEEQIVGYFLIALSGLVADPKQGVFKNCGQTFGSTLGKALVTQESYNMLEEAAAEEKGKKHTRWENYKTNSKVSAETAEKNARKAYSKWLSDDMKQHMENQHTIEVGMAVALAMIDKLPDLVTEDKLSNGKNEAFFVVLSKEMSEEVQTQFKKFAEREAALGFTICPPNAITKDKLDWKYRYFHNIGGAVADEVRPSEAAYKAVNAMQAVPFSANAGVLDLLEGLTAEEIDVIVGSTKHTAAIANITEVLEAWAIWLQTERDLVVLATNLGLTVDPAARRAEALAGMDVEVNEERGEDVFSATKRAIRNTTRNRNKSIRLRKLARHCHEGVLQGAREALEFDAVFFPAFMDRRTRVYSASRLGFGPQGNEAAKGLLTFADAKPLGEHGLAALRFELANAYGYDKLPIVERMAEAAMLDVVALVESGAWMSTDAPVKTLALCLDIAAAEAMDNPAEYVSAIPVGYDGTCSGIQHMSLMARDVRGAKATNVIGIDAVRADLYAQVAKATIELLEDPEIIAAAEKGYVWASGRPSEGMRKMVKRGVMTLPYGLQKNSLPKQLLDDDMVDTRAQANELAKAMWQAMTDVMPSAMAIRDWLQSVAVAIAKTGKNVEWTAASGSVCDPQYWNHAAHSCRLLGRKTNIVNYNERTTVRSEKMFNSIAPNVVHSFDASALQLTVNRLLDRDINTFSFIHDQFNCLAADAPVLAAELRLAHLDIYSKDVLAALYEGFQKQTDEELPEPPAMGELLVEDVLTSPHFFS
jgi:hypothetical protein